MDLSSLGAELGADEAAATASTPRRRRSGRLHMQTPTRLHSRTRVFSDFPSAPWETVQFAQQASPWLTVTGDGVSVVATMPEADAEQATALATLQMRAGEPDDAHQLMFTVSGTGRVHRAIHAGVVSRCDG